MYWGQEVTLFPSFSCVCKLLLISNFERTVTGNINRKHFKEEDIFMLIWNSPFRHLQMKREEKFWSQANHRHWLINGNLKAVCKKSEAAALWIKHLLFSLDLWLSREKEVICLIARSYVLWTGRWQDRIVQKYLLQCGSGREKHWKWP